MSTRLLGPARRQRLFRRCRASLPTAWYAGRSTVRRAPDRVIVATRDVFDTGGQLDRGVSGLDGGLGEGVGDEAVGMAGFDRTRWESTVFGLRKRVLVAVGHTILTSIWHMLTNDAEYTDLGADYFLQRTGRTRQTRRLVSQLNMLGHQMSLQSAEPA